MPFPSHYPRTDILPPRPRAFEFSEQTATQYAKNYLGDSVRPITADSLDSTSIEPIMPFKEMVEAATGKTFSNSSIAKLERAGLFKLYTVQGVDEWLYKEGALAWEDVGAKGCFSNWEGISEEDFKWFATREIHHLLPIGARPSKPEAIKFYHALFTMAEARRHLIDQIRAATVTSRRMLPAKIFAGKTRDQKTEESEGQSMMIFDLPAELRNRIYEMAIGDPINPERVVYIFPNDPRSRGSVPNAYQQGREPGLLRASKQTRREAMQVYYAMQKIVSVIPPVFDSDFTPATALSHLQPALKYMRNLEVYYRFNYICNKRSPGTHWRHLSAATVVLRIDGNAIHSKVYLDAAPALTLGHCSDEDNPSVDRGVAHAERMLMDAAGGRCLEKEGETKVIFMGCTSQASKPVAWEWDRALISHLEC